MPIAMHPRRLKPKDLFEQDLHGLNDLRAFFLYRRFSSGLIEMKKEIRHPKLKLRIRFTMTILFGLLGGLAMTEMFARAIEPRRAGDDKLDGKHPLLGWVPSSAKTTVSTEEYTVI
jgi:hypothetical protein